MVAKLGFDSYLDVRLMHAKWLSEMWRYRELVYFLAWKEVKIRYKQAVLGVAWAVLQPLLTMVVFTIVFGRFAHVPSIGDDIPYYLFAYCALVPWTYYATVVGQGAQSLIANSNLITKVYFPRVALPIACAASGLLDLCFGLGFLVAMMAYNQLPLSWSLVFAPAFLAHLIILTVAVSLLLAALNVRYRDIKYVIPFMLQIWLFVTPIIYPMSIIPERFRILVALNPLTGIIEGFRACLFGRPIDFTITAVSLAVTMLLLVTGFVYFRRAERAFADVI